MKRFLNLNDIKQWAYKEKPVEQDSSPPLAVQNDSNNSNACEVGITSQPSFAGISGKLQTLKNNPVLGVKTSTHPSLSYYLHPFPPASLFCPAPISSATFSKTKPLNHLSDNSYSQKQQKQLMNIPLTPAQEKTKLRLDKQFGNLNLAITLYAECLGNNVIKTNDQFFAQSCVSVSQVNDACDITALSLGAPHKCTGPQCDMEKQIAAKNCSQSICNYLSEIENVKCQVGDRTKPQADNKGVVGNKSKVMSEDHEGQIKQLQVELEKKDAEINKLKQINCELSLENSRYRQTIKSMKQKLQSFVEMFKGQSDDVKRFKEELGVVKYGSTKDLGKAQMVIELCGDSVHRLDIKTEQTFIKARDLLGNELDTVDNFCIKKHPNGMDLVGRPAGFDSGLQNKLYTPVATISGSNIEPENEIDSSSSDCNSNRTKTSCSTPASVYSDNNVNSTSLTLGGTGKQQQASTSDNANSLKQATNESVVGNGWRVFNNFVSKKHNEIVSQLPSYFGGKKYSVNEKATQVVNIIKPVAPVAPTAPVSADTHESARSSKSARSSEFASYSKPPAVASPTAFADCANRISPVHFMPSGMTSMTSIPRANKTVQSYKSSRNSHLSRKTSPSTYHPAKNIWRNRERNARLQNAASKNNSSPKNVLTSHPANNNNVTTPNFNNGSTVGANKHGQRYTSGPRSSEIQKPYKSHRTVLYEKLLEEQARLEAKVKLRAEARHYQ